MVGVCVQARAVRNLWIGGISPAISKQELQEEFQKFGKIEGVAFSLWRSESLQQREATGKLWKKLVQIQRYSLSFCSVGHSTDCAL
jgi:RNA recognition motif-containing protein